MRLVVLRSLIVIVVLGIGWLWGGRRFSLLLDRVVSTAHARLATQPLEYDGGYLRIGGLGMTLAGLDNLRYDLQLSTDGANRVVLLSGGRTFVFGPRRNAPRHDGDPQLDFDAASGDQLTLTARRSVIGWPTPFEFNLMGRSPYWKRYVYYELIWRKPSGQRLEMRWRFQQSCYSGTGWTEPTMMFNSQTGLLAVVIQDR